MFSSGTPARFFAQFVKFDKAHHPDVRTRNAFTSLHAFPWFYFPVSLQSTSFFFFLTSFLETQWFSFGHEHTSDLSSTQIALSALRVIFINLILSSLYLFAANEQIIMWAICGISVKLPHEQQITSVFMFPSVD